MRAKNIAASVAFYPLPLAAPLSRPVTSTRLACITADAVATVRARRSGYPPNRILKHTILRGRADELETRLIIRV
jgi:hypothetical protein